MSAPDLSRMSGQPQHDCPNCGRRSTVWFNPSCHQCQVRRGELIGRAVPDSAAAMKRPVVMDDLLEQLRDVLDLYAVAPTPGVVRDVVDAARAVLAEHDKTG